MSVNIYEATFLESGSSYTLGLQNCEYQFFTVKEFRDCSLKLKNGLYFVQD